MKILFLGDITGKSGRKTLAGKLPDVIDQMKIDYCIANGENAAGGFGITKDIAGQLYKIGINVLTSGNHIWDKKETVTFITEDRFLLRPANYPSFVPGRGSGLFDVNGLMIGIINISGRIFMEPMDCPFQIIDKELVEINAKTNIIIVDIHAEATAEKICMGLYLDGKVSAVIGTHTHVQTADEKILPGGTAYISDAGMTGPVDSVIGVKKEIALHKMITRMPRRFETAGGIGQLEGVVIDINESTGKANSINRLQLKE